MSFSALTPRINQIEDPTLQTDDAIATSLGQKIYLHGTAYRAGISPTVANSQGFGAFTVVRGAFVPYKMQDGSWRMRFNIAAVFTAQSFTGTLISSINGVTFKAQSNYIQSISGCTAGSAPGNVTQAFCDQGASTIEVSITTGTISEVMYSGDVELNAKPTWAF